MLELLFATNNFIICVVILTYFCVEELVCLFGIPVTASSALVRDWEMSDLACSLAGFVMTTLGRYIMYRCTVCTECPVGWLLLLYRMSSVYRF